MDSTNVTAAPSNASPPPLVSFQRQAPMYRLPTLFFLAFSGILFAQTTEQDIASTITAATVYLEGAQVERSASRSIPAGRSTLVLTGLTSKLDPGSVQVTLSNPDLLLLSVNHRLNFGRQPEVSPAEERLVERLEALDRRRLDIATEAEILKEEEAILKANRNFAGQQTGMDAEDLRRAVEFHRERLTVIKRGYLVIGDSLRILDERRDLLEAQLAELGAERAPQKATGEFVVEIQADRSVTTDLTLKYLIPEAGWTPRYDLRVTDIVSPVDLRYRAGVYQNSGEDWTDIDLKLSSGDPTENSVLPELQVWRLYPNSRPPSYRAAAGKRAPVNYRVRTIQGVVVEESGEPLIGATVMIPATAIGTVTDLDGQYRLDVPAGTTQLEVSYTGYNTVRTGITSGQQRIVMEAGEALSEVVVTGSMPKIRIRGQSSKKRNKRRTESDAAGYVDMRSVPTSVEQQATTVTFDIELPYTIPSDGKPRSVEIAQHKIPTSYEYFAVPKVRPVAYLTAELTGWDQFNLLKGEAQLFFEGTYLGNSYLDVDQTRDTLQVSLGKDVAVIVKREPNREFRDRGGFLSGKQTLSRGYTIDVRNTKPYPIRLTVRDQVPVSGQDNIEVEPDIDRAGELKEETGLVEWELDLPAREQRELKIGYIVKFPKGMQILLE